MSVSTLLNSPRQHSRNLSPTRAIASTLSTRSAPSIPPASHTYEPLAKAILRHRLLYRLFPRALLFSWLLVVFCSSWQQGGVSGLGLRGTVLNLVSPSTLAFAVAIWLVGIVPLLVLRKAYVTLHPSTASSPSNTFHAALSKASTQRALITHIIFATCLAFLHIMMAYTYEQPASGDPQLRLFVKSKKHPWYINGKTLFLVTSQISLGIACVARNVMLDRFVVRWSNTFNHDSTQSSKTPNVSYALTEIFTVFVFPALITAGHSIHFVIARTVVLPILFRVPILSMLLRPVAAHYLRGYLTLTLLRHASIISRAYYIGVASMAIWEVAESMFDVLVSEPVAVSHLTADPVVTLVSGATSSDLHLKHFAYTELRGLAAEESAAASARRGALFADQKFSPSLWSSLARECLLVLGRDYQLLLRRGKPAAPGRDRSSRLDNHVEQKPPLPAPPATPLIRTKVLKSSAPSPIRAALDTFASDGILSAAVASTSDTAQIQMPELFRSVLSPEKTVQSAVATVRKQSGVNGFIESTRAVWRGGVGAAFGVVAPRPAVEGAERVWDWWTRDRIHKAAEISLPNRHLDALAADVLSFLTCASLTEDQYGVVQRDIPKILEALLSFLSAVEGYQAEINAANPAPSQDERSTWSTKELAEKERKAFEAAKASTLLGDVEDALKEGVARIVRTFGDKLTAFKFPPHIATKLQGFVDYS